MVDLEKNPVNTPVNPEKNQAMLTEPQLKKLAHLPLLICFYLLFQKRFSSTPVTPLELAAYLGLDVVVTEGLLTFLEKRGWVKVFKEGLPAYSLVKDLDQITARDMIEWIGEIHELLKRMGNLPSMDSTTASPADSQEKYRKIYSDLASEMLQLFGEEAVNKLPL